MYKNLLMEKSGKLILPRILDIYMHGNSIRI